MGLDLATFFAVGIQNAVTPVHLATAGILVLLLVFLARSSRLAFLMFALTFILAVVVAGAMFDMGVLAAVFLSFSFEMVAGWSYGCLGVIFMFLGVLFFREWRTILAGEQRPLAAFIWQPKVWPALIVPSALLLAFWLAFLSRAWPMSVQATLQASSALAPGKLFYSVGTLLFYELCRSALLVLVLVFAVVFSFEGGRSYLARHRSLLSAVLSAFYLAAGGGMIHFFLIKLSKG